VHLYEDLLLELVTALGAALFGANAFALLRRRRDRQQAAKAAVVRSRPGSPVRKQAEASRGVLAEAPVTRTVTFMLIGLIVFVWGLATLVA
jgi:hypothetical protein